MCVVSFSFLSHSLPSPLFYSVLLCLFSLSCFSSLSLYLSIYIYISHLSSSSLSIYLPSCFSLLFCLSLLSSFSISLSISLSPIVNLSLSPFPLSLSLLTTSQSSLSLSLSLAPSLLTIPLFFVLCTRPRVKHSTLTNRQTDRSYTSITGIPQRLEPQLIFYFPSQKNKKMVFKTFFALPFIPILACTPCWLWM